ncbi:helix-turn-helix domain-containing protein [Bailinhaonella thermotolerans]|uniref:XRE family transcriptional regulator n=1 Tax=Bailinhaonella thermotolerans TaxID=1070861 RepID=A0A3A4A725_9ACTN|nr:helix-turn-helix transcriptional regulator [Bailinhaonella thermotolerans]RJL24746.1 XRE family transcriptional regulator [Bailinhaonella thermotolerans]
MTAKDEPGAGAELERLIGEIGPRLRALRRARGLTLEALSAETGISISILSRLESGKRRPALELLIPLARAHGVALDRLIAAPATGDPRVHLRPLRRRNRNRDGTVVIPLTRYPGRLQVFKQVIAPCPRRVVAHPGYEWLFVLAGELLLVLGDRELTLRPGEVAEFDTAEPHWFGPAGDHPVEILHIHGTRGDRPRVRARPSAPASPGDG